MRACRFARAGRLSRVLGPVGLALVLPLAAIASDSPSPSAGAKSPAPAATQNAASARTHDLFFSDRFLPRLFYREPDELLRRFSVDGSAMALELWNDVGERFPSEITVAPTGLAAEYEKLAPDTEIVWITLPPPVAATESYFVALVRRGKDLRYYTFEALAATDGGHRRQAVLGARDQSGGHRNFGITGPPSLLEFKASVRAHLVADTPPATPAEASP